MTFDFIGDIHGHAEKLKTLLGKLGYVRKGGVFKHPDCERNAVFLGDFIDRGPEIRETLEIVRAMVESKRALAIMGNHEYNAICFHTERPAEPGIWMRRRTDKNLYQYIETLYQFREYRGELAEYLRWFRTLPLWLDLGDVRAVHAAWHVPSMEKLAGYPDGGRFISDKLLQAAGITGSDEHTALENLLKGIEIDLPDGATLTDKDGNVRSQMRVRWWMEGKGRTYRELAFRENREVAHSYPRPKDVNKLPGYRDDVPVLFGHYWFRGDEPAVISPKIACLDYSVAMGGFLTAYTWRGEKCLRNAGFTKA